MSISKAIINVVTWGEWHNKVFGELGLKNLFDCIDELSGIEVELSVHTDNAEMLTEKSIKIGLDKKCILSFRNSFDKTNPLYNEQSFLRGQYSSVAGSFFKEQRKNAYFIDTQKALRENAFLVFYSSHHYFSRGILSTVLRELKNGKRVVFQTSVRANYEALFNILKDLKETPRPRELAGLIQNYYHNFFRDCDVDRYTKRELSTATYCFAKFLKDGFVANGFQGYVLGLKPSHAVQYKDGQDGTALNHMVEDFERDVYVLSDSDEGLAIDLNKFDRYYPYTPKGRALEEMLFQAINNIGFSNNHRKLALQSYVCHSGEITNEFLEAERKLNILIEPIIRRSMEFHRIHRMEISFNPTTNAKDKILSPPKIQEKANELSIFIRDGAEWALFRDYKIKDIERISVKGRHKGLKIYFHTKKILFERLKTLIQNTKIINFEIRDDFEPCNQHIELAMPQRLIRKV